MSNCAAVLWRWLIGRRVEEPHESAWAFRQLMLGSARDITEGRQAPAVVKWRLPESGEGAKAGVTMSKRWAIRVTYPSGEEAWLRHGSRIGAGPLATFGSRKLADINADFVQQGMDDGTTVVAVEYVKPKRVASTGRTRRAPLRVARRA